MGKIKRSLPENSLIHHPCNSIFICFMHRLEERIDHFNLWWLGTDRSSIARNLWPVSGTNNLIKFQNVKSMLQMKYYLGLFCKWKHGTVFSQHRLVTFILTRTRTYNVLDWGKITYCSNRWHIGPARRTMWHIHSQD